VLDNQIVNIAVAAAPTMITVLIGILISNARLNDMNARLGELRSHMDTRFNDVDRRFNDVDRRFTENERNMDRRFDDMKETWRSELHRVEEVLDARLKHLEER
jgi:hypothetical protein